MSKFKDLSGKRFGRIYVISYIGRIDNRSKYNCECDCGNKLVVASTSLVTGNTTSCGCARLDKLKQPRKHGLVGTKEYVIWKAIRQRCNNKNNRDYKDYGGRGIKIHTDWDDFNNFIKDMGSRPSDKHTIGRIDNNGNYEPNNCRWETIEDQCNNKRTNILVTIGAETKNVTQWCKHFGVKYHTVISRINRGWSITKIFNPIK